MHCTERIELNVACFSFEYAVKKQGILGGGTRSVKFAHAPTSTPVVREIYRLITR